MCSAEIQASMRRWRWRWRMRDPPPLAAVPVTVVEARSLDTWLTAPKTSATGPLADHSATARFPVRILPHSVRLRLQNQLRRGRAARATLHGHHLLHPRSPSAAVLDPRQLPLPADG